MPHWPGLWARAGPGGCGPWRSVAGRHAGSSFSGCTMALCPARPTQGGLARPALPPATVSPTVEVAPSHPPVSLLLSPLFPQPILPAAPPPALMGTPTPTRSPARTFVWHWFLPKSGTRSSCHPPGRMTWAWRAVGWHMLSIQDVGAHHGSAPPPVRTLEGRECCPLDLCQQGSRPPSVPAAGDSPGPHGQ